MVELAVSRGVVCDGKVARPWQLLRARLFLRAALHILVAPRRIRRRGPFILGRLHNRLCDDLVTWLLIIGATAGLGSRAAFAHTLELRPVYRLASLPNLAESGPRHKVAALRPAARGPERGRSESRQL